MSAALAPKTLQTIARVAIGSGRRVRFAMRGRSMLPLLREPMILEIAPAAARCKVGDVIVFIRADIQVAHRVIGYAGECYVTSGDAQPDVIEQVAPADVLGWVEAVWADDSASAQRVDVGFHRLHGWWCARAHSLRRLAAGPRAFARRGVSRVIRLTRRIHLDT